MKKGLINEAFRLQQLAGIAPINELNEAYEWEDLGTASDGTLVKIEAANSSDYDTWFLKIVKDGKSKQAALDVSGEMLDAEYVMQETGFSQPVAEFIASEVNKSLQQGGVNESNEEQEEANSIAEAFQKAGIDLNKPVTYIADAGNPSGTDEPATKLGSALLSELEDFQERYGLEVTNDVEGVIFEIRPTQGEGELLGDYKPEMEGLTCLLNVYFADMLLFEIWQ